MTDQEIFDAVLNGIRTQSKASYRLSAAGSVNCLYRGKDEDNHVTKCAAGMLVSDENYSPNFENMPSGMIFERGAYGGKVTSEQAHHLLSDLQHAHDEQLARGDFAQWEARMAVLAERYGLVYTPRGDTPQRLTGSLPVKLRLA